MLNEVDLAKPGIANLVMKRGASLSVAVSFTNTSDGTPIDLTGCTFLSQVRRDTSNRSAVLATITGTLSGTPTDGVLSLTSSGVATLDEGDYDYDVFCVTWERFVLAGTLTIQGSVSRAS
jgi:hypothetical protein